MKLIEQDDAISAHKNHVDPSKLSSTCGGENLSPSLKKKAEYASRHKEKSINEDSQRGVLAKTRFRNNTIQVTSKLHLKRWVRSISFRRTKAMTEFRPKTRKINKNYQLARAAKNQLRQTRNRFITENYPRSHMQRFEHSKKPRVPPCS